MQGNCRIGNDVPRPITIVCLSRAVLHLLLCSHPRVVGVGHCSASAPARCLASARRLRGLYACSPIAWTTLPEVPQAKSMSSRAFLEIYSRKYSIKIL